MGINQSQRRSLKWGLRFVRIDANIAIRLGIREFPLRLLEAKNYNTFFEATEFMEELDIANCVFY